MFIILKEGNDMWNIFNNKKKERLLAWQNVVLIDKTDKLIMTERELQETSNQMATNDLKIIQDCLKILSDTIKPDTFFSRLDLLKERSKHLILLEPYVKFEGASPTAGFNEVLEKEQEAIYEFIVRYFNATFEKAQSLKTEKGKENQYKKFYDSLVQYYDLMNDENIRYIEYKYKKTQK